MSANDKVYHFDLKREHVADLYFAVEHLNREMQRFPDSTFEVRRALELISNVARVIHEQYEDALEEHEK